VLIARAPEKHGRRRGRSTGAAAANLRGDGGGHRARGRRTTAFGRIDIMVHNAASFLGGPVEGYSETDMETVLAST
jgi:NAD(P)-dependent dehydrogenase (short-subunit alcohol dehydrogenase family)